MSDPELQAELESTGHTSIIFRPIGVIRSPFSETRGMPIQPTAARGVAGAIHLLSEYRDGLRDLEGFSHIILLCFLHRARPAEMILRPYLDDVLHGVFATRAPARPNAIGLSIVRLLRVEDTTVWIEDVDLLDGTPVLDIKPYVPRFDIRSDARAGWLEENLGRLAQTRDDGRFLDSAS